MNRSKSISPKIRTVDDIQRLNRYQEPPPQGALCDLLWGDPTDDYGHETPGSDDYRDNETRGLVVF